MNSKNKEGDMGWNLQNTYTELPGSFFTRQRPIPVNSPELVLFNGELAESMGLDADKLKSGYGVEIFSGNKIPNDSDPIAQAYAGHQFGHFTMLGDGRAILLGEQITPAGQRLDIQLKGSGRTPYSRGGDGRASLGPMIREYIVAEAMHSLKVPTTRSLAVVRTGETVLRERELPGAILTRVSSSHIRVGTFEYAARLRNIEELKVLAEYTIDRYNIDVTLDENPYIGLLKNTIGLQAQNIARWQGLGFIHGVMNTDNMAISGETIDYGPCAFMDRYDPETVFSSIDEYGRYAYGNQPNMASWNLARFGESLISIIDSDREKAINIAQGEVSNFKYIYEDQWFKIMRKKLGMFGEKPEDEWIIKGLLKIMYKSELDYTNTFRDLSLGNIKEIKENMDKSNIEEFDEWEKAWKGRLDQQTKAEGSPYKLMKENNPKVIPRNHCVEDAIEAAVHEDDFSLVEDLNKALSDPYNYDMEYSDYYSQPKEWEKPYRTFCGT